MKFRELHELCNSITEYRWEFDSPHIHKIYTMGVVLCGRERCRHLESEFNELIEGNSSKRNITKEKASEAYIKGKLKDHQEYLGCEESRRMTLIQSDMYTVQQAFEDGWDEAMKELWKKAIPWLKENVRNHVINNTPKYGDFRAIIGERVWQDFKKAMEKQL